MHVKDRLAGGRTCVLKEIQTCRASRPNNGIDELWRMREHPTEQVSGNIPQVREMLFGDEKRMAFGKRIHIEKRNRLIRLPDSGRRDIARSDLAENAICRIRHDSLRRH